LPKTVTRQRSDCDLNPGPSAPKSSTLTTRIPSYPCPLIFATANRWRNSSASWLNIRYTRFCISDTGHLRNLGQNVGWPPRHVACSIAGDEPIFSVAAGHHHHHHRLAAAALASTRRVDTVFRDQVSLGVRTRCKTSNGRRPLIDLAQLPGFRSSYSM